MARAIILMEALERERERDRRQRLLGNRREDISYMDLSDTAFRAHYRLTKRVFEQLCDELTPYLHNAPQSTAMSIEGKVLVALSFLATGSYQKPIGMNCLHATSQPSVSRMLREVVDALNHPDVLARHIYFPRTQEDRQAIINGFANKFGFPGCLGCVDCTHVALVKPHEDEERFFNRKHYHSRNVQIICDSDLNILNVDASFGGATHDAYIWRNSEAYRHLRDLSSRGEDVWFLGDSGYPLRPWLLTPIVNAEPGTQEAYYTKMHSSTRNTVERCIGLLKSRWRCLLVHRVLHYDHHMVAKIINACAVLHNICNRQPIPPPEVPPEGSQEEASPQGRVDEQDAYASTAEALLLERGHQQRAMMVQRLWNARMNE